MPDDETQHTQHSETLTTQPPEHHKEPVILPEEHTDFDTVKRENNFAAELPQSVQPSTQPVTTGVQAPPQSVNTPGVLVLQWLTYAFWGWALVALYWLTTLSIGYFVDKSEDTYGLSDSNTFLAYALAAVIVLFVIAIICDIIYSRFEPARKTGAAMVIMIIHTVIFALCGIGSLIAGVFAFVSTIVGDGSGAITAMATAGIMTLLYGATLLRTIHPAKIKYLTRIYWMVMLIATFTIAVLGIVGPAAYAQHTKGDRIIEEGLSDVSYAINDYATRNSSLPESLKDINLGVSGYTSDAAQQLIDDNMVTYKPKEELRTEGSTSGDSNMDAKPVYHYQLCVTYTNSKGGPSYDDRAIGGSQDYDTNPSTDTHAAGYVCYDLQTDYVY